MSKTRIIFQLDTILKKDFEKKYRHVSDRLRELMMLDLYGPNLTQCPDRIAPSRGEVLPITESVIPQAQLKESLQMVFPYLKEDNPVPKYPWEERMKIIEQEMKEPDMLTELERVDNKRETMDEMVERVRKEILTPHDNGTD